MTLAELNQAIATGDIAIEDVTADIIAALTPDFEAQRAQLRNTCKGCNGGGKVSLRIPQLRRNAYGQLYFTGDTEWGDVTCKQCGGTGRVQSLEVAS